MATLLQDNFTDTDGTVIESHSMDVGSGWDHDGHFGQGTTASSVKIQDNGLAFNSDLQSAHADAGESDVEIDVDFTPAVGGDSHYGILIRWNDLGSTGHGWLVYFRESVQDISCNYSNSSGTAVFTDGTTGAQSFSFSEGTTYAIKAQVIRDIVRVLIDDVEQLSFSIPGSLRTRVGLGRSISNETDTAVFDNFIVADYSLSIPSITPVAGEVAIWCPSLDTAGNGTSRLFNLVGTTKDMGLIFGADNYAGNWIADTDNGGSVALNWPSTGKRGRVEYDFENSSDVADYSDDFDVSLWFKTTMTGTGGNRGSLIGQGGANTAGDPGFRIAIESGGRPWVVLASASSRSGGTLGAGGFNDGDWHHLLVAFKPGGTTVVYVDGSTYETFDSSSETNATTTEEPFVVGLYDGDYAASPQQGFVGRMDDIRIGTGLEAFVTELASQRAYQPEAGGRPRIVVPTRLQTRLQTRL